MKISSAIFAVILACNCFNSITSATIETSAPPDLVVPRDNRSGVLTDIQPAPENYTVTPDESTTIPVTSPIPDKNVTTTPAPETTTSNVTTTTLPTPTPANITTSTEKPTIPPKPDTTTTTTTEKPTTIPPKPDTTTTTEKPAPTTVAPVTPTPSPSPYVPPTPAPHKNRFDGPSFIGGIVLSLGLVAIAFVGWKYYKARTERNYRTL